MHNNINIRLILEEVEGTDLNEANTLQDDWRSVSEDISGEKTKGWLRGNLFIVNPSKENDVKWVATDGEHEQEWQIRHLPTLTIVGRFKKLPDAKMIGSKILDSLPKFYKIVDEKRLRKQANKIRGLVGDIKTMYATSGYKMMFPDYPRNLTGAEWEGGEEEGGEGQGSQGTEPEKKNNPDSSI